MSSIASPSTTTRHCAILAINASMRSRERRLSAMALLGKRRGVMRAVGDGKCPEELRLRDARDVAGVADKMHAAVRGNLKGARLDVGAQRHPHDALDHADEQ